VLKTNLCYAVALALSTSIDFSIALLAYKSLNAHK